MTIKRLHATITGRVQGVGFRYFIMQNAVSLELTGWVANRFSGDVEMLAEGENEALQKMLTLLYKGPRSSLVMDVQFTWAAASGEFDHFEFHYDY